MDALGIEVLCVEPEQTRTMQLYENDRKNMNRKLDLNYGGIGRACGNQGIGVRLFGVYIFLMFKCKYRIFGYWTLKLQV